VYLFESGALKICGKVLYHLREHDNVEGVISER